MKSEFKNSKQYSEYQNTFLDYLPLHMGS